MTKHQRQIFHSKLKKLQEIPDINRGGCAIVALELQKFVKQNLNIEANIVYLFRPNDTEGINNANNNCPDSCNHAVLQIGNRYYDTDGHYSKAYLEEIPIPVSSDYVKESIAIHNLWNPTYNRKYNSTIRQILANN